MKRRVIRPYKILAVAALGVGAGCTTAPAPAQAQAPEPPATAATAAPSWTGAPAPRPPADGQADRKLLALRAELDGVSTAEEVVAKEAHFRPLCDKDGYPLVGNVNRKSVTVSAPSTFCASLRAKKPS
jgi:hypothetical protein